MIEAFQHPRLTFGRSPAREGIRFDDAIGDEALRLESRVGDDLRFFVGAYLGAFVFFLAWLG